MSTGTVKPSKEAIIKALKEIFSGAYKGVRNYAETPGEAMDVFFDVVSQDELSLTEDELKKDFPNTGEAFSGVTWNVVLNDLEGEGGPAQQRAVVRFTLPDGEVFFLEATFEWVSWDGFYYEGVADSIKEVHPREKVIIEYV